MKTSVSASDLPSSKKRILVVDDEEVTRLFAIQTLLAAGYAVDEAEDGTSVLKTVNRFRPDLIILDVLMPGKDGFEVCRELRQSPKHQQTPILVMTGLDDAQSVKAAFDAGATDFVTKPISWALLCQRVQFLLRASDVVAQLARSHVLLTKAQKIAGLSTFHWNHSADVLRVQGDLFSEYPDSESENEMPLTAFWRMFHPEQRPDIERELTQSLRTYGAFQRDCRLLTSEGAIRHVHLHCETVVGMDGSPLWTHGTLQDITQRKLHEEEARRLAFYDSLTGLPNRLHFKEQLERTIHRSRRDCTRFAVLFLDIDNFKRINDSLGHDAGDELLRRTAAKLESSLRQSDTVSRNEELSPAGTVSRLGGDEFIILLEQSEQVEGVAKVADRILREFATPNNISSHEVFTTTSIGIAIYPDDGLDGETLLKNADAAMYVAKGLGRNRFQCYDHSMNTKALRHLELDSALRKGLEREEFFLQYQPRVDARTGEIIGGEALIRWRRPDHGVVAPVEFIPFAEETGLILWIDAWVLEQVCRQIKNWRDAGHQVPPIAVNVSGLQFSEWGLAAHTSDVLAKYGINPDALHIEITESVLMRDTSKALDVLTQLNDMGVSIEIDDFGVGFSSLSYLNRFPVKALKIDLSFVRNIPYSGDNTAITRAIVSMAKSLELGAIAEGVETVTERDYLISIGCHEMQGYLFGYPCDPEVFVALLSERVDVGTTYSPA